MTHTSSQMWQHYLIYHQQQGEILGFTCRMRYIAAKQLMNVFSKDWNELSAVKQIMHDPYSWIMNLNWNTWGEESANLTGVSIRSKDDLRSRVCSQYIPWCFRYCGGEWGVNTHSDMLRTDWEQRFQPFELAAITHHTMLSR